MKRRELLLLLACMITARQAVAQEPTLPVVGFFRSTPAAPFAQLVAAFQAGLAEAGFENGRNVTIEYRWGDNQRDRLPELAADLIARKAAVVIGNSLAVEAMQAATSTTPIVFVLADDPVAAGYAASLSRPGGHLTGVTFFGGGQLGPKRLELLLEIVPKARKIAILIDPNYPGFVAELPSVTAAVLSGGRSHLVVEAANESALEGAFDRMAAEGADALLVGGSPVFTSRRRTLVGLANSHRIPAIYDQRDHVAAGGLISYGSSFAGAYRQAGIYAGRILKGEKPAEMPVLQPSTFELAVNLGTARDLGLSLPASIMLLADEVIE